MIAVVLLNRPLSVRCATVDFWALVVSSTGCEYDPEIPSRAVDSPSKPRIF